MNRRAFNKVLSATLAASVLPNKRGGAAKSQSIHSHDQTHSSVPTGPAQQIGMLIDPTLLGSLTLAFSLREGESLCSQRTTP